MQLGAASVLQIWTAQRAVLKKKTRLKSPWVKEGWRKMLNSRRAVAAITAVLSLTFVGSNFFVPNFRGYDDSLFPIPLPDPLIVPAAYAFAIWGPIFIWLIVGLVWALIKRADDAEWHATRLPLIVSLAVGTFWLPVAVVSPIWATVMICVMLGSALVALYRSPNHNPRVATILECRRFCKAEASPQSASEARPNRPETPKIARRVSLAGGEGEH